MTPALLLPAGLAALAALAIPLLIHLARRTEQRPTDFAALRWLHAAPRPHRRPRFDERLLLLVRLVLLALLALAMARPVLIGAAASTPWVAVVPGVDPARAAALVAAGAHGVWLAPGFPPLAQPAPAGAVPVVSLVRELDADLPRSARLSVLVPPVIETADAERPRVSRPVDWRIVPGRMAARVLAPTRPPALAIRYVGGVEGLRYLRAALGAADVAPVTAPLPHGGALVWLAPGALPVAVADWAAAGGTLLLPASATLPAAPVSAARRDTLGAAIVEEVTVGRGRVLRFTRPLVPAAMPMLAEPGFPAWLSALLAAPSPAPKRVAAIDMAPEPGGRGGASLPSSRDLRPWLAPLIAAVFVIERWLATRRRRAAAP